MNKYPDRDTVVEILVEQYPQSVSFLRDRGIVCVLCGEPVWGTLGDLMNSKNIPLEKQEAIINELKQWLIVK